jgi:hypothetical protein
VYLLSIFGLGAFFFEIFSKFSLVIFLFLGIIRVIRKVEPLSHNRFIGKLKWLLIL